MKNIFALILLISLLPASGYSEEVVSKKYFVKGMTCGGCILGVKVALKKSDNLKIEDKEISVGVADLKFEKKNYVATTKQSQRNTNIGIDASKTNFITINNNTREFITEEFAKKRNRN